jgi:RNA polymerase sigma factor (sigma-70 family)
MEHSGALAVVADTSNVLEPAFAAFYVRTRPAVYRAVLLRFRSPELAEDACQEAYARAYGDWARIGRHPNPIAWVVLVAQNQATSWWRRRHLELPDPPEVAGADHADPFDEDLIRLVWRLPERQRQVIGLRVLLDLSVEDTADVMKVTPGTVKATLHHALAALRHELMNTRRNAR